MAKKLNTTEQEKVPAGIIISQITVNRVNRQILDIGKWRQALQSADMDRMTLLYDLYEDILLDGRLWDAIDRRIRAVTGSDLTFQFADGTESQELIELIDSEEFEYLLNEIMQSLFWGVSLLQLDFTNGMQAFSVPRKHIRPKSKTVAHMQNDVDGAISYEALQNVIEVVNKKDRLGLILRAAPYVIMMRGGIGDWAQMVELFGMPQRVGKYSVFDQEARKALEDAFATQGAAASMVVPKETDVETASGAGSVNSSIYKDFIAELKEAMLVTVLSNTMTTLNGSSRSQSEVHQDVEDEVNKHDLRFVQRVLNKKLKPILEARGYKVANGSFVFPKALKELTVEEIVKLADIIEIPAYFVQEKYGIPAASDGDVLAGKKPEPAAPVTPVPGTPTDPNTPPDPAKPKKEINLSDNDRTWFEKVFKGFFANARTQGSRAMSVLNLADSSKASTGININALFKQALNDIYKQYGVSESEMEPFARDLYTITDRALQKGIDREVTRAGAEFGVANADFIQQFKTNASVFAAFKAHKQTAEVIAQLLDENGNLRSFDAFRKAVTGTSINADYNRNWLKAEYNVAVRSARMAVKLKQYEKTKRLYPNLEYMPSTAANPRPEHKEFWGTILPMDHPFWKSHMPPSEWGCECSVRNTDKEVTKVPESDTPVDPIFDNNPAETAEFINMREHPYMKQTDAQTAELIMQLVNKIIEEGKQ